MSTLVLLSSDGRGLVERRASLRDRFAARVWPDRLDRALASGVAPDTNAALALRAGALIGPPQRRSLARQLIALLRDASSTTPWAISRIPPRRQEVLGAADVLERLARRLLDRAPVDARGVARTELLLRDGTGPLYSPGAAGRLAAAAASALESLEPPRRSLAQLS
jgi:hypothetical protein